MRAAVRLEARKRALPVTVAVAPIPCPRSSDELPVVRVALGPGAAARLADGAYDATALDLGTAAPDERAAEVARAALVRLSAARAAGRPTALVDLAEPAVLLPAAAPPPESPPAPLDPGVLVTVGGGYAWLAGPDVHRGLLDGEAAATLWSGRLAVGLAGTWSPSQAVADGEPSATAAMGELLGVVRGGLRWGDVLLRLGVGGGWQWRRVTVRSERRFAPLDKDDGAAALLVELDAVIPLGDRFVLAVALPGRVWFGGRDYAWDGRTVFAAPRGAIGATVRLGLIL